MVTQLIVGPPTHGVTRLALDIARTEAMTGSLVVRVEVGIGTDLVDAVADVPPVHLHVTDRLLGTSAGEAADVLTRLGGLVPMSVTLHDLPQPSDGSGHDRRAAAYARIVEAARGVVVSSEHERLLLADALRHAGRDDLVEARTVHVVPLPIEPPAPRGDVVAGDRDLVVLGFLYPGKGHEEALAALGSLPPDVGLVALGRPSDGHEDLADALAARAASAGRRFSVTGFVPDDELVATLQAAAVPVAPHQHLSASGSIGTWISAGRRPIVPRSRYVEELAARCPGVVWVYDGSDADALAQACAAALADPASTWLDDGVVVGPSLEEVGRAYADVLTEIHG